MIYHEKIMEFKTVLEACSCKLIIDFNCSWAYICKFLFSSKCILLINLLNQNNDHHAMTNKI